jgi:hypothetical protein
MNRINYDLIINELGRALDRASTAFEKFHGQAALYGLNYYQEFCTIGFTVPRQLGKSRFLMQRMEASEESLMVVRDKGIERVLRTNHQDSFMGEGGLDHPSCIDERLVTVAEFRKRIQQDLLPQYHTYYFDEASLYYHFIKKQFFQYLWDTQQLTPRIVLVG